MNYKNLEHFEKTHGRAFVYILEQLEKYLRQGGENEGRNTDAV
ncbi:MAG: hypothetical protein V1676_00230 [Candidatus Diapherotrites archaeon]